MEQLSAPLPSADAGTHFARRNIAFQTVKSAGLGFLGNFAFFYAINQLMEGMSTGMWSLVPSKNQLTWMSGIGSVFGALAGFNRFKHTQAYNDHARLLNKYERDPKVQGDIISRTAIPGFFHYPRTSSERLFSTVFDVSIFAWFFTDIARIQRADESEAMNTLSKTLGLTTAASALGWLVSHVAGINTAVHKHHTFLRQAEKDALAGTEKPDSSFISRLDTEKTSPATSKTP